MSASSRRTSVLAVLFSIGSVRLGKVSFWLPPLFVDEKNLFWSSIDRILIGNACMWLHNIFQSYVVKLFACFQVGAIGMAKIRSQKWVLSGQFWNHSIQVMKTCTLMFSNSNCSSHKCVDFWCRFCQGRLNIYQPIFFGNQHQSYDGNTYFLDNFQN